MMVFLAGFPRDSDDMVKMMVEDVSFKDRLLKYINSVVYCSALDEQHIVCPCCSNQNAHGSNKCLRNCIYETKTRKVNPVRNFSMQNCSSVFGRHEVLRHSINEMIKANQHEL